MLTKYIRVWWYMSARAAQVSITSRFGAVIFILGKLLRFLFFFFFLFLLASKTKVIANYTLWQVVFFFLSFNLVDTFTQFFLREVYRFRYYVLSGNFDYILTKPISPLFRSLFGGCDVLDIPLLFISLGFIVFSAGKIGSISILPALLYCLLMFNACLIALSFHIFVLSVGVMTTEVDNTIMLYRDLTQMGRIPVDIYQQPVRSLLTFAIPVGIMMTFPTKALLGLLSWQFVLLSILISAVFLTFALLLWKYALTKYTSASS